MAHIKKSTIFLGIAALAGLVAALKFLMPSRADQPKSAATATGENQSPAAKPSDIPPSKLANPTLMKDATAITVTAKYTNPAGEDEVGFTVYVDSTGTIVNAEAAVLATHDISKKRQIAFAADFPTAVKGKKLSELDKIDRVGGSSLTTGAFNSKLAEIKASVPGAAAVVQN